MNGVRSTYMRKGYLLTALAAAVLLAASSGTALAQSIGFVGSSGIGFGDGINARPAPLKGRTRSRSELPDFLRLGRQHVRSQV